MPDATLAALQELRSHDLLPLAAVWFAGRVQAADAGPALFIAAALEVTFARHAAAGAGQFVAPARIMSGMRLHAGRRRDYRVWPRP